MNGKWLGALGAICLVASVTAGEKVAKNAKVEAEVNNYYAGEDCCQNAVPHEMPFVEGETPTRPCKGYFWTLITKPAVFKCVSEQIKISEPTFYMKPIPAKYEWVEEQIQVAPVRQVPYCEPAQFRTKCERVVVQEEHTQLCIIPAEFEDVCETIVFRPEIEKEISVPAQYATEMMTIQIEPERDIMCAMNTPKELKVDCGESIAGSIGAAHAPAKCITIPIQKEIAPATTKKIVIPAITKTVKVRKLKKPATVQEVKIPAVYEEIPVETCVGEECIKYREIPAEYKCIRRMELKEAARTERVDVPAKYQTFNRNEVVEPAKLVWRQYSINKCKIVADVCARYGCLPASSGF